MHGQEQVLAELTEAFRDPEPPQAIGPNGHSYEARRAADFFAGRRWEDVTFDLLRRAYPGDISACLEFLSPEAGLYFLPAYLRICLVAYGESDMLPYTLERQLSQAPTAVSHFGCLAERLSAAQRRAVARVLEFVQENYEREYEESGAAVALQTGWNRYLAWRG
jgi:hypothetical protein